MGGGSVTDSFGCIALRRGLLPRLILLPGSLSLRYSRGIALVHRFERPPKPLRRIAAPRPASLLILPVPPPPAHTSNSPPPPRGPALLRNDIKVARREPKLFLEAALFLGGGGGGREWRGGRGRGRGGGGGDGGGGWMWRRGGRGLSWREGRRSVGNGDGRCRRRRRRCRRRRESRLARPCLRAGCRRPGRRRLEPRGRSRHTRDDLDGDGERRDLRVGRRAGAGTGLAARRQ